MSINLAQHHQSLFAPPVSLPIRLLMNRDLFRGLFGIDRIGDLTQAFSVSIGSAPFRYRPVSYHEGVDLEVSQTEPVFAARRGEVVEVRQTDGTPDNMLIVIRHVELGGQAFTTRYIHLQNPVVEIGDNVERGECIAFVGRDNHLHFEIRHIMMPGANDWHWINTEPVDPLPYLYPWEKIYYEHIEQKTGEESKGKLQQIGIIREHGISMYRFVLRKYPYVIPQLKFYVIPLYNNLGIGEERLINLLELAHINKKYVHIVSRESPFFGDAKIITEARVIN